MKKPKFWDLAKKDLIKKDKKLGNIIGLLNIRSLNIDMKNHLNNKKVILEKIVKPWFIPSSTNLLDQLVEFKKKKEIGRAHV